ncbi:hypothetical protein B0H10DRAFT_2216119 [Mycena sp. CBHHK59/15]|nr:hypothetical protein B0H10DRAFT_2216119 [Mycena sp. CBHHK59/15]
MKFELSALIIFVLGSLGLVAAIPVEVREPIVDPCPPRVICGVRKSGLRVNGEMYGVDVASTPTDAVLSTHHPRVNAERWQRCLTGSSLIKGKRRRLELGESIDPKFFAMKFELSALIIFVLGSLGLVAAIPVEVRKPIDGPCPPRLICGREQSDTVFPQPCRPHPTQPLGPEGLFVACDEYGQLERQLEEWFFKLSIQ